MTTLHIALLDISTAHITAETREYIASKSPCRWLWACIAHARATGHDYLRLDSDGEIIDGLPTYDEEA